MTRLAMPSCFLLASSMLIAGGLAAQCINGTKTYPIYKAGADKVRDLDEAEKEIVHVEYDLIFDSKDMYRTLSPDWTYTISAFADGGVSDVNVAVLEYDDLLEEWTEVSADRDSYGEASLDFTPSENQEYMVNVSVTMLEGYTAARYGLIIHHD